ncbi:MAG: hypothetical protein M1818_001068 [Claussenomyces sp. TS43310]|nr:MAG: hypothetical protein M1818_001068 [Claussenomyces sp. TS43310]
MSHLSNPLATAQQLYDRSSTRVPAELQASILFAAARLTQAAGILLRLPQDVAAQAIVLLQRFLLVADLMASEFSDVSAASIYLAAKISASPRSLRSTTNVYAYLLSPQSALDPSAVPGGRPEPTSYYLSESSYVNFRNRLLNIEGQILNALGFNMHVALPHSLAITYLQTLDVFGASYPRGTGEKVGKRAVQYLNTALLGPQMLYLTHQPSALATAAIYLAARDADVKLPDLEWWEVFDTDREELGFLALGMKSLEGWVQAEKETWSTLAMITRSDVRAELKKRGDGVAESAQDEEDEMMRMLDEKVG